MNVVVAAWIALATAYAPRCGDSGLTFYGQPTGWGTISAPRSLMKGQAVALMDAYHLGRLEGRETPAQRDAALRQLWEGTSS